MRCVHATTNLIPKQITFQINSTANDVLKELILQQQTRDHTRMYYICFELRMN